MSRSRYSDEELRRIYAARYPGYHQVEGPPPSSHLIVLALAVQYGMEAGGHVLEDWRVNPNRMTAATVCGRCGARTWATTRKVVPTMSEITDCRP
jgi:hypothetical protein